jgi:hypothetical protein
MDTLTDTFLFKLLIFFVIAGAAIGVFTAYYWVLVKTAPKAKHTTYKLNLGDRVRKTKGSQWQGHIVGTYSTALTPEGYAVESETHAGSVQIYPDSALEYV